MINSTCSKRTSRKLLWLAMFAVIVARSAGAQEGIPTPPPVRLLKSEFKLVGNMSCSSVTCHGRQEPLRRFGTDSGQEFVHWMHDDPHAKAARTLQSEWFYQILVKASNRDDGLPDMAVYRQCAACHDPAGLETESPHSPLTLPRDAETLATRGIACESCHGNAEHWVSDHFRAPSREQLTAWGMIDLKHLPTRARQCSVCHVGDAEHDLPHDFYGAGHPPLHFEVASYHALIKRKHWDEGTERRQIPEFEARLWLAGQLAGMEGATQLLAKRAHADVENKDNPEFSAWPEFAEHDCQACHQQFRPGGIPRTESGEQVTGFPKWREWSYASANLLSRHSTAPNLIADINALRAQMNQRFPLPTADIANRADNAAQKLAQLSIPVGDSLSLTQMLTNDVADSEAELTTCRWDLRAQRYLLLIALEKSGRDEYQKNAFYEPSGGIAAGSDPKFTVLTQEFNRRAELVRQALAWNGELQNECKERTLSQSLGGQDGVTWDKQSSVNVSQELVELARILQQRVEQFPIHRN